MPRYYIGYPEYPGDIHCTVGLSTDTGKELLEAAI
jgi:hypothetical protein